MSYSVAANTTGGSRSQTFTVAGQTFTITQAAAASPNCTATLSASNISLAQGGDWKHLVVGVGGMQLDGVERRGVDRYNGRRQRDRSGGGLV